MALYWTVVLIILIGIVTAQNIDTRGGVTMKDASGTTMLTVSTTTGEVFVSGTVSATGFTGDSVTINKNLLMISSTLPTCNTGSAGQMRRSTNKICYCNGTAWQDTAPAAVTVLGISVLSAGGCP